MSCSLNDFIIPLYYAQATCAGLSVISSFSMIVIYLAIKQLQVYYFKIVMFIALSDCLRSIIYLIPPHAVPPGPFCKFIAILDTYLAFNIFLWSLLVSLILFEVIVKSKETFVKYEKFFKIFSVVYSPLYLLPLTTNSYNENGSMCTYDNSLSGNMWRLFLYTLPAWFCSFLSMYFYYKIIKKVKAIGLREENKELIGTISNYPIVLFLILAAITIARVIEAFDSDNCVYIVFYFIAVVLICAQGSFNAIIFFLTPMVRNAIRAKIRQRHIYSNFVKQSAKIRRIGTEINLLESTDSFVNQVY